MNKQSKLKATNLTVEFFAMYVRRIFFTAAFAVILAPAAISAQQITSAAVNLNELGPENSQMAQRAGIWDVTETAWDSADGAAAVIKLVAERKMIGAFLQETLEPAPNSAQADIKRID